MEGDDLIEKNVVKRLGKNTAFVVTDVEFEPGPLGGRELCISWNDLTDYIRIQVCTSCHVDTTLIIMHYGLFTLPDSDSYSDSDSEPYGYIVLYRNFSHWFGSRLGSLSHSNCIVQESKSE